MVPGRICSSLLFFLLAISTGLWGLINQSDYGTLFCGNAMLAIRRFGLTQNNDYFQNSTSQTNEKISPEFPHSQSWANVPFTTLFCGNAMLAIGRFGLTRNNDYFQNSASQTNDKISPESPHSQSQMLGGANSPISPDSQSQPNSFISWLGAGAMVLLIMGTILCCVMGAVYLPSLDPSNPAEG